MFESLDTEAQEGTVDGSLVGRKDDNKDNKGKNRVIAPQDRVLRRKRVHKDSKSCENQVDKMD